MPLVRVTSLWLSENTGSGLQRDLPNVSRTASVSYTIIYSGILKEGGNVRLCLISLVALRAHQPCRRSCRRPPGIRRYPCGTSSARRRVGANRVRAQPMTCPVEFDRFPGLVVMLVRQRDDCQDPGSNISGKDDDGSARPCIVKPDCWYLVALCQAPCRLLSSAVVLPSHATKSDGGWKRWIEFSETTEHRAVKG